LPELPLAFGVPKNPGRSAQNKSPGKSARAFDHETKIDQAAGL